MIMIAAILKAENNQVVKSDYLLIKRMINTS